MNSLHENEPLTDHSDSDDWLIVSRPDDPSDPAIKVSSSSNVEEAVKPTSSSAALDSTLKTNAANDDGLTEIDLTEPASVAKNKLEIIEENEDDDRISDNEPVPASSSSEPSMSEFQVVDSTTDNDELDETLESGGSNNSNKRQSLSDSDLNDYVDFGRRKKSKRVVVVDEALTSAQVAINHIKSYHDNEIAQAKEVEAEQLVGKLSHKISLIKQRLDELSDSVENDRNGDPNFNSTVSLSELFNFKQNKYLFVVSALVFGYLSALFFFTISLSIINQEKSSQELRPHKFDFLDLNHIPITSQQLRELKVLNNDLSKCIQRQHPASFIGYSSSQNNQDSSNSKTSHQQQQREHQGKHKNLKVSRKNLVCYGHESEWRRRFESLKSELHLDLGKLVKDSRRRITNDLLEKYNPAFQFKLILNQLEYLEFLENKKQKRQTEDTIKYLKAQNLQLLRRLNQSNDSEESRKLLSNLELKNSRLQAENKALKASLTQKAGPSFIKQSNELEKLEGENYILKEFHHEIARDLSISLRQFNVYTVDASRFNLDDSRLLNSQLLTTRENLRKLKDKISTILLENDSLKQELKETHSLIVAAKVPISYETSDSNSIMHNRSNNPLTSDSCVRDLISSRKKVARLEEDIVKLTRDCQKCSKGSLQPSSGNFLNKTTQTPSVYSGLIARLETAMEKPNVNAYSLKVNDIFDDLMAISFDKGERTNDLMMRQELSKAQNHLSSSSGGDDEHAIKVLPNYIRETYAQKIQSKQSGLDVPTPTSLGNYNAVLSMKTIIEQPAIQQQSTSSRSQLPANHVNHSSYQMDLTSQLHEPAEMDLVNLKNDFKTPTSGNRTLRDSWFFKRAKQRRELRQNKENFQKRLRRGLGKRFDRQKPVGRKDLNESSEHPLCVEPFYENLAHTNNKRKLLKADGQKGRKFSDRKQQERARKSKQKNGNKRNLDRYEQAPQHRYYFRDEL